MKALRLAAIIFVCLLTSVPARSQETTLRVGFLGSNLNYPLNTYDISTATIDSYLSTYLPSQFAPNYTRNKANTVFASIESMRAQLNTQLVAVVNSISNVSVRGITINANSLEASFGQTPTGFSVAIRGISVDVAVRYNVGLPLICDSADGSFRLDNISVGGDYDLPTGTLVNPRASASAQNVHVSCNGLLSDFTNVLIQAFAVGYVRDLLNSELQSAVSSQLHAYDMRQIFSVHDFLEGLRNVSNLGVLNSIANHAIDAAEQVVSNPSSLYRAVELTVGVNYGPSGNEVRFIVSNAEPTNVVGIQYGLYDTLISFAAPTGTSYVDLYQRYSVDPTWYWMGTYPASQGSVDFVGGFPLNTVIAAVGQNEWISEAHSEIGVVQLTTYSPTGCTDNCGPISTN